MKAVIKVWAYSGVAYGTIMGALLFIMGVELMFIGNPWGLLSTASAILTFYLGHRIIKGLKRFGSVGETLHSS